MNISPKNVHTDENTLFVELQDGHARIVTLMEEEPDTPAPISFKNGKVNAFKDQGGVAVQRELRDEW